MVDPFQICDACGLNRATLHLDEVVDASIQMTAHLCNDCWYRLGVRIPLGNIWRQIEQLHEELLTSMSETTREVEEILADDELGELLDPSSLAVAEPDEEIPATPDEAIFREDEAPAPLSTYDEESNSDEVPPDSLEPPATPKEIGIHAVRIEKIHGVLVSLLPLDLLQRCKAIPFRLEGTHLTVAVADPFDSQAIGSLEMFLETLNLVLVLAIADEKEILQELARHSGPPKRFESLS